MVQKRKGRSPQRSAGTVKVNNSKSDQNENQNNIDKTTAASNYNRAHDRRHSVADTVVLIGADELHGNAGSHHPTVATNTKAASAALIHNPGTGTSRWTRTALVEGTRSGKMPHPWFGKWGWWFLPLVLISGALGAWWGVRHIEGQVQAAAPEILKAAGVDPSGLTFDATYRNIAVAGELPQGVTIDQVERLLENSTGAANEDIRYATVTARAAPEPESETPPAPEPVVVEPTVEIQVTAVSDGQLITLSGTVPNQEHANRLLASAAMAVGENNVINELTVPGLAPSASEPDVQIDRLAQVLPQLGSGINSAELRLGDESFNGSIDAIDTSAKSQLDPIVATASANEVTVTAPAPTPLQVDVFANYQGRQIILYGEVINRAQSQTLIDAAAESVGERNVVSTLKLLRPDNKPAASDAQIALMGETLRQYGGLRSAESRLNASSLYVRGVADNAVAKQNIDQALQSGTDESVSVAGDITVLDIDSELNLLQQEFDLLAGEIQDNIVFATNSDVLNLQATAVLDKVVNAIKKFDRARIEVSGHTDAVGPATDNQVLSARRATAVSAYLVENGVEVERLRAIGLGESQPISDNSTATGRQQNRRVEFRAVESF